MKKTTVSVRVEDGVLEKLRKQASDEGRNTSNMIARILDAYYANKEQNQ